MKTAKEWTLEQRFSESNTHGLYGYVEFEAEKFCELVKQIQIEAMLHAADICDAQNVVMNNDFSLGCKQCEQAIVRKAYSL
jgi:hypothetical protein